MSTLLPYREASGPTHPFYKALYSVGSIPLFPQPTLVAANFCAMRLSPQHAVIGLC